MNVENSYWYFRDVIPKNICDDIIKFGLQQNKQKAIVGDEKLNPKIRKSNVAWLDEKWIYNEIHPYILKANENAKWNYDLNRSEHCQFTIYDPGQYYDWHVDAWVRPYLPQNQKTENNEKNAPFECGFAEFEDARIKFDVRFYLVAILFIVFDLEVAFLFPWVMAETP